MHRKTLMASAANGVILAAALMSGSSAAAAESVAGAPALEEVVVTAQRRSENLQNVPVSVTALTASALTTAGVGSTESLLQAVPGVVITRQGRASVPYIRGVGSQDSTIGNEAAVATYIDGVYYMDSVGNVLAFNNIDRVEILKGPQGTLFGRNATGGMINIITRDPTVSPEVRGGLSYGNYHTVEGTFYATGGKGDVAADLAVYGIHQGEGFGRNLLTGDDVNLKKELNVRSKILWTPSDSDRLTLSGDWGSNKADLGTIRQAMPGAILTTGVRLVGTIYDSQQGFRTYTPYSDNHGLSLRYEHSFPWGKLSMLSAYRFNGLTYHFDQDGTPTALANVIATTRTRSFQNEAVLTGAYKRLEWTTGVFIFNATSRFDPLGVTSSAAPTSNYDLFTSQETNSYAGFAQGTYAITDRTKVTAGFRYTHDSRAMSGAQIARAPNPAGAGAVLATRYDRVSFPKETYRIAIDHRLTPDVLVYLSYNTGFKSGLYNLSSISAAPIRPETLGATEVGIKSELLDRTLRLNVAAFHYSYKDIQLSRLDAGATQLLNAASGKVRGLDVDALFVPPVPVGKLTITWALSILDATYESFPNGPLTVPRPAGGNATVSANLSGKDMIRSPKWTTSIGLEYAIPLGDGEVSAGGNFYHSDGFFWDSDNRIAQGAYNILNAHAAYSFAGGRYKIRAFANNLGDTKYYSYVTESSLGDFGSPAPPRTYGVGLDFQF